MKYIIIAVVLIILIVLFKNWWENNWRSYYGEGIRKFRRKDYYGASEQLFKAKLKNPNKWEIAYYCGLADKHISDRMNSRDAIDAKKFAITSFLDCLVLNPNHLKSNNMIEMILCNEKDPYVLKELIKDTRDKLENTSNEVRNHFKYIDVIEQELIYKQIQNLSDANKMKLKGRIKSLKEDDYFPSINNNLISTGKHECGRYYDFNKKGKIIKASGFGGSVSWDIEIVYDEMGNQINDAEEEFNYDEKGNLSECKYINNPYFSKTIFKFDKTGNKTEEIRYKLNGEIEWMWAFRYDENNRLVEKINNAKNQIGLYKVTFDYDKNGNKKVSNLYNFDESLLGEFVYEYDNYGNLLNDYKEDFFNNPIIVKREITYFENDVVYYQ